MAGGGRWGRWEGEGGELERGSNILPPIVVGGAGNFFLAYFFGGAIFF